MTEGNFHQLVALLHCRGLHKVTPPCPSPNSSPKGSLCLGPPNSLPLLLQPCQSPSCCPREISLSVYLSYGCNLACYLGPIYHVYPILPSSLCPPS